MIYTASYQSPLGPMILKADDEALCFLEFGTTDSDDRNAIIEATMAELDEYYQGKRTEFTLPLRAVGTPFQMKVWQALSTIPYGETRSYGQIAAQVDNPKGSRAVGMANNRNPISIIIPCHRVIGADGKLVGYGGGLDKKVWLLDFEQRHRPA
ncbi:MAG: methylated-DNA--[protein]-cysteine S-methyltransferase [Sphaerochaeta sp.]|nr:methylated-DNA--[protein]-cysteine S-methyltransferase [Sphaerochaeta sp.]MDX9914330.1 methylated-DNA--[protein]-cysteine S-methyltransferase [Sphaerochaeta sp.]